MLLKVGLERLESGMQLALPVKCQHSYKVLVHAGTTMTKQQIERLRKLGAGEVYIFYPDSVDYPGQQLYQSAICTMCDVFEKVNRGMEVNLNQAEEIVDGFVDLLPNTDKMLVQLTRFNDADSFSISHSVNVCIYSLFIGAKMSLKREELKILGMGALLHDIGKQRIPEKILRKPSRLTDGEFSIVKKHSGIGYDILKSINVLEDVRTVVRDHHEKCDGSGYPRGIMADEISFLTKIVTISDIYDAVTADRTYRAKMLPHEGMEILMAESSVGKLDSEIVAIFVKEVICYPVGCVVLLSTGDVGKVVQNSSVTWRPKVAVTKENTVSIINLAVEPTIFIQEIVNYTWVVE